VATNELLIMGMLEDEELDFLESPAFRNRILTQAQESVEILLGILKNGPENLATRAGEMLSLFNADAVPFIASALDQGDSEWREQLLVILWSILASLDSKEIEGLLQTLAPHPVPLLRDSTLTVGTAPVEPVEQEYRYRLCDEAYAMLQYLRNPDFEEDIFRHMDEDERDKEIQALSRRLSG
jgi:hypothetical protein